MDIYSLDNKYYNDPRGDKSSSSPSNLNVQDNNEDHLSYRISEVIDVIIKDNNNTPEEIASRSNINEKNEYSYISIS